jgi:oligopeptide transport system substrate-binding protein
VRWSDGTRLTAEDVEYAWKRVLDPVTGSPNAGLLHDIMGARAFERGAGCEQELPGVRVLDAFTLEVELEEPTGYFLHLLANHATFPVPRHAVERYGGAWAEPDNVVTNGPFKLGAWHRGKSIQLVRNPTYYGQFSGNVQQVNLALLPGDPRPAALEMYEADQLDVTPLPDPPEGDLARRRHAGEYISLPQLRTTCVGFDTNRSPFDDRRVRQAFVLAVDREWLADVDLGGYVFPATGGFVPPGMPGHAPGIGLPFDPERARQLLAEAGYPDGRSFPVVHAMTAGLQSDEEIEAIQLAAMWRDNLGVEIEWKVVETGEWVDRANREPPHMFRTGWVADYPDPDNVLRVGLQRLQPDWRNPTYDGLVEQARHATVPGERIKLYQQADEILVEEVPLMPICYFWLHVLVKPWVSRFPISGSRYIGYWKDVIIESHEP